MTCSTLSTAAIVCAVLAAAATLATWAQPDRSWQDLTADTLRRHAEGEPVDLEARARAIREAYPVAGTEAPFHGVWLIALCTAAGVLCAVGASMTRVPGREQAGEGLLRGAGGVLAIAFLLVLVDASSAIYGQRVRAFGLWAAMGLSLLGCLAATFASARVPGAPDEER